MERRLSHVAVALLVATLAAAPSASAMWRMHGSHEPDTPFDRDDGLMHLAPDTDASPDVRKVYFNAVAVQSTQVFGAGVRFPSTGGGLPLGAADSRVVPPAAMEIMAYLGVWKDCNDDGYIGSAQGVLFRYRVELLSDPSRCPAGTLHNEDGWVWEFIPIQRTMDGFGHLRGIVDRESAVWADLGRPGETPLLDCQEFPVPSGTTSRTGGLLAFVDCQAAFGLARAVGAVDADGSLGLRFEDPEHPERDCRSALNQPLGLFDDPHRCDGEPVGLLEAESGEPSFSTWDCAAPRQRLRDPTAEGEGRGDVSAVPKTPVTSGPIALTDEGGTYASVATPRLEIRDPRGSYVDGLNMALTGVAIGGVEWDPCGTPAQKAEILNLDPARHVEAYGGASGSDVDAKRATDYAFYFESGTARDVWEPYQETEEPYRGVTQHFRGWDRSLGVYAVDALGGAGWKSTGILHTAPGHRGGLVGEDAGPAPPTWITAYARVSQATAAAYTLPAGVTTRTYGVEACQGATTGEHGGWDCEAANWWRPDLGGLAVPHGTFGAKPGTTYHLRDVDCLDGDIGGTGVRASLVDVGGHAPCG